MKDRAETPKQKEEVLRRILIAWKSCPELRLGQLLINACQHPEPDIFYIEDYALVRLTEAYLKR